MAIPDTLKVTVKEFIDNFGSQEVTDLTNLEHPTAESYMTSKLPAVIDRGFCDIEAYDIRVSNICAKYAIRKRAKTLNLDISRYYLDILKPDENVKKRYEDAIAWLDGIVCDCESMYCNLTADELAEVGLEGADVTPPILCTSEKRVFTRNKSINTWVRDRKWRFTADDSERRNTRI